ncbi:Gmad2 immunoglobulin-like domain-containing protein [Jiangella gansuensis]|uniref:Gmad2 immunoglobulin-like domain-containing protein n=1 Tax=Jiangella gansuensis TaxID=281473 RepID=UPI0004AF0E2B|nr:Gmad2 immunoglobulin-like domain-containing protein [Jiangella gansuensis]
MNTPEDWTPEEQRLHAALNRAAEHVEPGPDGLAQIRRRTKDVPLWRRPVLLGLAAATAVAVAVLVGGVMALDGSDDPIASTTSSPSRTPADGSGSPTPPGGDQTTPPSEPPSTGPVETLSLPVYFVADSGAGPRLAREFQTVETADPPVLAALRQLADPADPDYSSLWQPDLVRSAEVGVDVITVDLTALPEVTAGDTEPSAAELAVQQVVYTATAAAASSGQDGSLPVRITVEGQPVDALDGVSLAEPVGRADPLEVRQLMQLNEPAEGATVTSPVAVMGEAATFEANVPWEVRRDGEVVEQGATTAAECCTFAEFQFEVELEPGTYEVVITEEDVSGGEGRPPMSDSRTFTVE